MVAAKKNADHPLFIEMISAAITALKERKGSSRQAIVKYIKANYKVGDNVETVVKMTLKRNIGGRLVQTKGTGASGSFKLSAPAAKKPAAKKPAAKKPAAKKAVAKKPSAKKTPKKTTTATKKKTPKKAAKKTPTKKSPAKKAVKKSKAKKTPTKKSKK
uniref:Histone H1.2 n=1 Tax=Hydractinia echinata TaxID=3283270 RepID=A0A1B3IQX9_HYDEC|nr:histone H1.2 [Hydractinia echinata]